MQRAIMDHHQQHETVNRRLRKLRRRTIRLGIFSALVYPAFTGFSRLLHLITSKDGNNYPNPDPISDFGMMLTVAGLTLSVALAITYRGMKDWSDPDSRSNGKALRTALVGLIATPFSFAFFAMALTVINVLVHKGTYP